MFKLPIFIIILAVLLPDLCTLSFYIMHGKNEIMGDFPAMRTIFSRIFTANAQTVQKLPFNLLTPPLTSETQISYT